MEVNIIGAGLAGCECALQLAKRGIEVNLYEMRPKKMTGAHTSEKIAEFVCSNSLGSYDITNASGLLKKEMELLGGELIKIAYECQVPAGGALAIDRELFSKKVTELIEQNPNINIIREEITQLPDTPTVISSGPLTSDALADSIKEFTQSEHLHFFDAIAPIVEKDSINFDIAFWANRYDKGDATYINCPMNKEQYEKFYNILINAPKIELKEFEKSDKGGAKFFESCLPIEVLASRGVDTLRFGPMKPVGLVDKRKIRTVHTELNSKLDSNSESWLGLTKGTAEVMRRVTLSFERSEEQTQQHKTDVAFNSTRCGEENYAVVQLRQDDSAKTLYNLVGFQTNLKWSSQKELLQSIPGLENVNIVRYGVMHRNTFINSPKVLNATLQSKKRPDLFFAGQITGTEGYTESIATGMIAGINMEKYLTSIRDGGLGNPPYLELPKETMIGALCLYISDPAHEKFQPINSNWGIIEPIDRTLIPKHERKNKKFKNELLAKRSIEALSNIISR